MFVEKITNQKKLNVHLRRRDHRRLIGQIAIRLQIEVSWWICAMPYLTTLREGEPLDHVQHNSILLSILGVELTSLQNPLQDATLRI